MIYKRGNTFWFSFVYNGQRIQKPTKIKVKGVRHDPTGQRSNKEIAKDIESAYRTQLAKGEVGIENKPEAPIIRTFADSRPHSCNGSVTRSRTRARNVSTKPAMSA